MLVYAQRFPDDWDGLLSIAPVLGLHWAVGLMQRVYADTRVTATAGFLGARALAPIHKSVFKVWSTIQTEKGLVREASSLSRY